MQDANNTPKVEMQQRVRQPWYIGIRLYRDTPVQGYAYVGIPLYTADTPVWEALYKDTPM